jgi:oligoribonuclease (3'-5' exoribonuclease)
MKYVSLDLETTGIFNHGGKAPDKILQLSAVVEDTSNLLPLNELPHYTVFVAHDTYRGEAYALQMNAWILKEIAQWESTRWKPEGSRYVPKWPVMQEHSWPSELLDFLKQHFGNDRVNVAGKNVAGFDLLFLPDQVKSRFRHRVIDPGSMFVDFTKNAAPGLDEICKPLGISAVTHDAYDDALSVIEVIRRHPRFPNLSV